MLWLFLCLFSLLLDLLLSRQAGFFLFFWLCLAGVSIPGGALAELVQDCVEVPGVVTGDQEEDDACLKNFKEEQGQSFPETQPASAWLALRLHPHFKE